MALKEVHPLHPLEKESLHVSTGGTEAWKELSGWRNWHDCCMPKLDKSVDKKEKGCLGLGGILA